MIKKEIRSLSDVELLARATPARWQRLVRTLGCPAMAVIDFAFSQAIGQVVSARFAPWIGALAGLAVFFVIAPALVGVLSGVTGLGRGVYRRELRLRLGQAPFRRAVDRLLEELSELTPDQRGWVVLLQGHLPRRQRWFSIRLDVRTDGEDSAAQLKQAKGPRIDFFGPPLSSLAAWQREEQILPPRKAAALATFLEGLLDRSIADFRKGSGIQAEGALVRVAAQPQVTRFRIAGDDLSDRRPAMDLLTRLLALSGWESDLTP